MVRLDNMLVQIKEKLVDRGSYFVMEDVLLRWNRAAGEAQALHFPAAEEHAYGLKELFINLSALCEHSLRPIVLIIDEVDSAGNHQVFIDFLAQLRGYYLESNSGGGV